MLLQSALTVLAASIVKADIIKDVPVGPPMGFNPWARFECDMNQTVFTEAADAMAKNGMREVGYEWVNLDDCWPNHQREKNGSLSWNETLFPDGFYYLRDYLNSRKFKFGIYSDSGTKTCGGYPGSEGYEEIDAETFKRWGIDYLKLDGCYVEPKKGQTSQEKYYDLYHKWHGIIKDGYPMVFSESAPAYFCDQDNLTDWYTVMDWVPFNGQLARHSDDIAVYEDTSDTWGSILNNYYENTLVARLQDRSYTNDPDFLIADHPDLTVEEIKSQFALWASFGAPLIVSAHIPSLDKEIVDILTNKDLIDVDQDKLALQATIVSRDGFAEVLTRYLSNGDRLLTVLNRQAQDNEFTIPLERIGYSSHNNGCKLVGKDLWTGKTTNIGDSVTVKVASHGTAVIRISGKCKITPTGAIFNTKSRSCLDGSGVKTTECDGSKDSQVWTVEKGVIKSLGYDGKCLAEGDNGKVSMSDCSNDDSQKWKYAATGNLVNLKTGHCLTEGDESVNATTCGYLTNEQVFEAPSGFLQFENPK